MACTYRLEMQTSDVRKAGTAGSVFLTIIGDACTIGEATLDGGQRLAGWRVGWEEGEQYRGLLFGGTLLFEGSLLVGGN